MAKPFTRKTDRDWENLSCDGQFALAKKIAGNIGYVLVPEPSISEAEDNVDDIAQARAEGYAAGLETAAFMVDLLMKREFPAIGFTDPHPPMTAAEIVAAIRAVIPKQEEKP